MGDGLPSPYYVSVSMSFEGYSAEPPAMMWFKVYAGVMAGVYILCALGGVAAYIYAPELADAETSEAGYRLIGMILGAMGATLAIGFLVPFFVPRQSWVWVYNLILICFGFGSGCTLIPCVFLLLAWIKPEVQIRFGRT